MEPKVTSASFGADLVYIHNTSGGHCIANHMWIFAGGRDFVPEGTFCDCGKVRYETPKYCDKCGHQI